MDSWKELEQMSKASTEMVEMQKAFVKALESNEFTEEDMKRMLVAAVPLMSAYDMERLLGTVGMDRYDLS